MFSSWLSSGFPTRQASLASPASGVTQKRPNRVGSKPAKVKEGRDVDCDARGCSLRRHEQRLERRETTTSSSLGTAGMAVTTHRARDGRASGNGGWLPESGGERGEPAGGVGGAGRRN